MIKVFSKMVSVNVGSSYHTSVCSRVEFKFGFNELFDAIKKEVSHPD